MLTQKDLECIANQFYGDGRAISLMTRIRYYHDFVWWFLAGLTIILIYAFYGSFVGIRIRNPYFMKQFLSTCAYRADLPSTEQVLVLVKGKSTCRC